MRQVFLHGHLGEVYGHQHRLEVNSLSSLCWAMECNKGKFFEAIKKGSYQIFVGDPVPENSLGENELSMIFHGDAPFHLIPVIEGSGSGSGAGKAIGMVVLGIVIVATAGAGAAGGIAGGALVGTAEAAAAGTAFMSWGSLALFGGLMALGGLSQLMAQTPGVTDYSTRDEADEQKSFLFNGPVNTIEQGTALPIVIGKHMVGSTVVSAGIRSSAVFNENDNPTPYADPFTITVQKVNTWVYGDAGQYFTVSPDSGVYDDILKYSDWTITVTKTVTDSHLSAEIYVDGMSVCYINIADEISYTIYDITSSHSVVVYCKYEQLPGEDYE